MLLRAALAVLLAVAAATGNAQSGKRPDGRERQMSREERQRMRDDMREVYRQRQDRPPHKARQQQMSPEERGRLRRDIEDANKDLKR